MKKLLAWVNATFPGPFESVSDLHHTQQQETYNCGIYASNTIAHAIFGDELLTPERAKYERLNWFIKCADYARARSQPEQVINIMPLLNEMDLTDYCIQVAKTKSRHKA